MSVKEEVLNKIGEASRQSDTAIASYVLARKAVEEAWPQVSTYGVIRESRQVSARLLEAKGHIEEALRVLNETKWPNESDYDQL